MERRIRDFLTERSSGAASIRAMPDYAEGSCYSPAGLPFLEVKTEGATVNLRIPSERYRTTAESVEAHKLALQALSEGIDIKCTTFPKTTV